MNEISNFSDLGTVINVSQITMCLALSFLLNVAVAKVYQITYKGPSFSASFMHTLVVVGMVVGAVMLIIGSNIARAFSLVGALSIIRFRNAVKDTRDIAFIFLTMAVGMACGTGFYLVGIMVTLICCFVILLMYFTHFGDHGLTERVLRIQTPPTENFESIFDDCLKHHADAFNLVSAETTRMGTELELTFSLRVPKKFSAQKLIDDLSRLNENLKIQLVGSQHVLNL